MVDFQFPLPGLARDINSLTQQEKEFVNYFAAIDPKCIYPVVQHYVGIGPRGYGTALIIARILKIRERILTDRQLARALKQNDLYRFVTNDSQPAHNTFHTLRSRLGVDGFSEIHKRFVLRAYHLGLLEPDIKDLPKNRRKGIVLVADSTFLITAGSTIGHKDEKGVWHFPDETVAFSGKAHHSHKYAVGHKAHSLRTISGIPMATILTSANEHDQSAIMALLEMVKKQYPYLTFAYIILDKGYDADEYHEDIYEFFDIIPIIIRKKMVYPKDFSKDGYPLCRWGFSMKPKGLDYERKRTKYACFKICKQSDQPLLFSCEYVKEQKAHGFVRYTHFQDNYRKYGPAVPHSLIYKKLKPFRTGIERTFALVKENRYRMEISNCYKGIENVTIHCIEHDIVLTQDIICDYIQTGKLSPGLNLNY